MVDVILKQPLDHLSLWRGQELQERADWQIRFTEAEIDGIRRSVLEDLANQ